MSKTNFPKNVNLKLNSFSIFAGTAIIINFLLTVTWFPAALVIWDQTCLSNSINPCYFVAFSQIFCCFKSRWSLSPICCKCLSKYCSTCVTITSNHILDFSCNVEREKGILNKGCNKTKIFLDNILHWFSSGKYSGCVCEARSRTALHNRFSAISIKPSF